MKGFGETTMKLNKLTVAVTLAAALGTTSAFAEKLGENLLGDRFIVHAKPGALADLKQAMLTAGATVNLELNSISALAATITPENYELLKGNKSIASIEVDAKRFFAPIGETTPMAVEPASHLDDFGYFGDTDFIPWGIEAVQALEVAPNANNPRTVCVIDSGYYLGHPDLQTDNVTGEDEGAGSWYEDGLGHGTHVSGTLSAQEGNDGVVGVLPDGTTNLHIVRLFNDNGNFVYASGLIGAINDCADAGAHVINMSLGGSLETNAEKKGFEQIRKRGVLMIAAAGNDGNATHSYPASYDSVVSVAAVDRSLNLADFSQYTSQVELSGPGVNVISTVPGGFSVFNGTSMATPHVVGVAALVWSHYPNCSSYDIRDALRSTAMDLSASGRDYNSGFGMVQAKDAMDYLAANECSGNPCRGNECRVD